MNRKMTDAQRWYVAGAAYRLNRQLVQSGTFEPEDTKDAALHEQFVNEWECIDPLTENMTVYRGTENNKMGQGGYASASLSSEIADSFVRIRLVKKGWDYTETKTGEFLVLNIQSGVKVMKIPGCQQEVVIEPGVGIKITHITRNDSKNDKSSVVWMTVTKK